MALYSTLHLTLENSSRVANAHRHPTLYLRLIHVRWIWMDLLSFRGEESPPETVVDDVLWLLAHVRPQHLTVNLALTRTLDHFERLCTCICDYSLNSLEIVGWPGLPLSLAFQIVFAVRHTLAVLVLLCFEMHTDATASPFEVFERDEEEEYLRQMEEESLVLPKLVRLELGAKVVHTIGAASATHPAYCRFFRRHRFPRLAKLWLPLESRWSEFYAKILVPHFGARPSESIMLVDVAGVDCNSLPDSQQTSYQRLAAGTENPNIWRILRYVRPVVVWQASWEGFVANSGRIALLTKDEEDTGDSTRSEQTVDGDNETALSA